jgi:tagaturonate reductase
LRALADPAGFPVIVRGLVQGQTVHEERRVTSIRRALDTATDWDAIRHIAAQEAQVILSNTSEQGWVAGPADRAAAFDQAMSYPAKLTHLLAARFEAGGDPIQIMPTELVPRNGDTLRARVLDLAGGLSPALAGWIAQKVVFVNSLVDRIVSAPLDPAGAVTEPYALWAIEDRAGLVPVCRHPAVVVVADLGPVERRKLFVLNLGHTWLVSQWLAHGGPATVREVMADPIRRGALEALYAQEVLPVFAAAGDPGAAQYVQETLDRFANPYLDHRLADIAQGHGEKLRRRIGGFLDWTEGLGMAGRQPRLRAALG